MNIRKLFFYLTSNVSPTPPQSSTIGISQMNEQYPFFNADVALNQAILLQMNF